MRAHCRTTELKAIKVVRLSINKQSRGKLLEQVYSFQEQGERVAIKSRAPSDTIARRECQWRQSQKRRHHARIAKWCWQLDNNQTSVTFVARWAAWSRAPWHRRVHTSCYSHTHTLRHVFGRKEKLACCYQQCYLLERLGNRKPASNITRKWSQF